MFIIHKATEIWYFSSFHRLGHA